MNKVFLIGRLTRDPELRYTTTQAAVANFSIAVDRNFRREDGTQETDFINIEVWNKAAENVNKYLKKGSQVAIDGSIRMDRFNDKDGNARTTYRVVATNVQFLSKVDSSDMDSGVSSVRPSDFSVDDTTDIYSDFGKDIKVDEISDEELPF